MRNNDQDISLSTLESGLYDELPLWSAPFGLKLLEKVKYKPGLTIVDIGSGTGFPLLELAMRMGPSAKVYGIDPWPEAVEVIRLKISKLGLTGVRVFETGAESIPLQDGEAGLVTSNNGINNVNDREAVFSECARILKKGGQFLMTMNTGQTMIEFYRELESVLEEFKMQEAIDSMHEHILHKRPPVHEIRESIGKFNLRVKTIDQHLWRYNFADAGAMFSHHFIRSAFLNSWHHLVPDDHRREIFKRVEGGLNQKAVPGSGITLSIPYVVLDAVRD